MYLSIKMISLKIDSLDHIGFNVADPERSLAFYTRLGLRAERVDEYRAGQAKFPSVRINAQTILDFFPPEHHQAALGGGQNVNHIALTLTNTPEEIVAFLWDREIPIVREMTENFGAQGDTAHAFHIMDPDGNMLELHAYE